MDYTSIRGINAKYIFLVFQDGREDRVITKKSDLLEVLENFKTDDIFYNRVILESGKIYMKVNIEVEKLQKYEKQLEANIEENKEDPLYRRGLADACFHLKYTENQIREVSCKLSGIREVISDARNKRDHAQRMIKNIESVLKGK